MAFTQDVLTLTGLNSTGNKTLSLPAGRDPKAVIVVASHAVTSGTVVAHAAFCMGFGTYRGSSVQQSWCGILSEDGATTMDSYRAHGISSIIRLPAIPGSGADDLEMDLVSMQGGGTPQVVFNVANAASAAWACTVVVLGGDDIEDAVAGAFTCNTAAATQDVDIPSELWSGTFPSTWTGKPDLLFFLTDNNGSAQRDSAYGIHSMLGFGVGTVEAASVQSRGVCYGAYDGGADSFSFSGTFNDRCLLGLEPNTGATAAPTEEAKGSLSILANWPTNGFEITWEDHAFASDFATLAIKFSSDVVLTTGVNDIPTTAVSENHDASSGTAKGFFAFGARITSTGTIDVSGGIAHAVSFGFADVSGAERLHVFSDDDAATSMNTDTIWMNNKAYGSLAPANPATLVSSADSTFGAAVGGVNERVTLDWSADPETNAIWYEWLIISEAAAGGTAHTVGPIADSVTLSDDLNFQRVLVIADSVTMSDDRVFDRAMALGDAVSLSDALALDRGLLLSDSVTASDEAVVEIGRGVIVDDSVTLSDEQIFARGLSLSDSVTPSDVFNFDRVFVLSDSVTLSDGLLFDRGLIIADSVTVSDDITAQIVLLVIVDDSVPISDAFFFDRGLSLSDSVTLSDDRTFDRGFSISDSISPSDVLVFGRGMTLADSIAVSDTFNFARGLGLEDSVSITDALSFSRVLVVDDSVSLADLIDPVLTPGGGGGFVVINDTLIIKDSLARALNGEFISDGKAGQRVIVVGRF